MPEGLGHFSDVGLTGLSRGTESHIEEIAYDMLKDPDYQDWMAGWLERFLAKLLAGIRRRREDLGKPKGFGYRPAGRR